MSSIRLATMNTRANEAWTLSSRNDQSSKRYSYVKIITVLKISTNKYKNKVFPLMVAPH